MLPSLVRSIQRQRPTLERRVARELAASLGEEAARAEAAELLDGLALGVERDRPESLRRLIHARSRRWLERGADPAVVGRAMLALLLPPGILARVADLEPSRSALERPSLDPHPAPLDPVKDEFAALLTVSHAVANSLELRTILVTIAEQVRQVIQTDECTVFLYDEREQLLKPEVCDVDRFRDEIMGMRLKLGEGITGSVAQSGIGEIVNDAEHDPRAARVPGTPEEKSSLLCVPLLSRDAVAGVITLTRNGGRSFEPRDLELATVFAGHCSTAIANARHYEETHAALVKLSETQAQLVRSAKLNALGELAGGVAHDFNNILAAVLGRTQLLLQTVREPEVRRQLQVIEQAALDGAHSVRRVQEFTRVRSDESFLALDLNQVLVEVVELTRPVWEGGSKQNGVRIEVELDLAARQTIAGNGSEMREVFANLVLNAVDALPWGGRIRIATLDEGGEVVARIRDDGVGMDEETRLRVFDPFFSTKTEKGTGLGLSVAYGIVTRHHGTIGVASEPHLGAEFTVRLPAGPAMGASAIPGSRGPMPRLRVLAVDDEQPVLDVLADLLRALGQEVDTALGGSIALECFERGDYHVVFTDLGMPGVSGWELALQVRARRPDVAVVVVTGWGFQLDVETARAHGVDLVVAKPFSLEDIERALRQVGDAMALRRQAAS